jgi:hypothetical protein
MRTLYAHRSPVSLYACCSPGVAGKESTAHENEQLRSFSMAVGRGRIVNRLCMGTPPSCVSCKGGGALPDALAAVSIVRRDEEG